MIDNRQLKKFFSKVLWWQPITLLVIIAIFGLYEHSRVSDVETATTYSHELETSVAASALENMESQVPEAEVVAETYSFASASDAEQVDISEDGNYTSKYEVALYIHSFNKLPSNYISKKAAEEQGWDPKLGNLDSVLPGMSIGGSTFGNYEGKLPKENGRKYYECDIDYDGGNRNAKRIVYSSDGLIFYTEDHYNTFEKLY